MQNAEFFLPRLLNLVNRRYIFIFSLVLVFVDPAVNAFTLCLND